MITRVREHTVRLMQWSERYLGTDVAYLASGGSWLLVGQIGALVFSFALAIIFGHFASQDTYGNYKYIINASSLITIFSLSGIGTAITRSTARGDEGALREGFRLNLRWSGGALFAGLLASIYYFYVGNSFAGAGFALAAFLLPLTNSLSLYDPFLQGRYEFRTDALYSVASLAFTTGALALTLLFFSQRAIILVGVYFATNLLSDLLWYVLSARRVRNDKTDPEMFRYGFHLSVMGVISSIADKIDSIVVFTLLGPAQLAVYSYAIAMPEQLKAVIKSLGSLSMPRFARRSVSEIRVTIWSRLWLVTLGFTVAIALYILLAPLLFRYLFPIYLDSTRYSQIYALSIIVTIISSILTSIFQAHQKTKELYISSNVGSVFLILLLPPLVYLWGIWGAVAAQLIYRLAVALISIVLFVRLRD